MRDRGPVYELNRRASTILRFFPKRKNSFLFENMEDEKPPLERHAITDYLTEVDNIRYFYHLFMEEFSRMQRSIRYISGLMLRIVRFSRMNDTYGYKACDLHLRKFALPLPCCPDHCLSLFS